MVAGISAAIAIYVRREIDPAAVRTSPAGRPIHRLLEQKFYLDAFVENVLVRHLFYGALARGAHALDRDVVDGAVNGAARVTFDIGRWGRLVQNGQVQVAGSVLFAGGLIAFGAVVIFQ